MNCDLTVTRPALFRRQPPAGSLARRTACLWLLAASVGGASAPTAWAADPAPLKVVASFSVIADMVREVGGPWVEVHSLVPPGADAHVFSPTPVDAQRLAQADLFVVNGLGYEGWIDRLVKTTGYRGPVVVLSQGIQPRRVGGQADPHAWHSLAHARSYADTLRAALSSARPAQASAFAARAGDFQARLARLERDATARFAALPAQRRQVITGHDAFGYLAQAYGLRFIAPRGLSSDAEPSAGAIAQLVRQIRELGGATLLAETVGDPRLLQRIARESGARVGGRLYAESLSPPGGEADTYLRMSQHNIDTLLQALADPAPAARP